MTPSRLVRLPLLAALLLMAMPSFAGVTATGSAGWLIRAEVLHEGPGTAYDRVGQLPGKTAIRVDRCTYLWCQVHAQGERGWVSRRNVNFGQHPRGPFTGPRLNYVSGGTVCFYEGRNFTGDSVCARAGTVVHDLLLFGLDNRYSSVAIPGRGSVTVCRDRDFSSYCERIVESQPVLDGFLDNNVTSYRVH